MNVFHKHCPLKIILPASFCVKDVRFANPYAFPSVHM